MKLLVTFFAIFTALWAQISFGADNVPEGMGFILADNSDLPKEVRKAAKSTFRLVLPSGALIPTTNIFGDRTVNEIIEAIKAMDSNQLAQTDKIIYLS